MTRTLLAACTVLFVLSQQLDAACMVPPPPCDALAQSEVVFYGEVLEVASRPHIVGSSIALLSVRFNVLRAFKGVKEGPFLETFYYGSEGGSLGLKARQLVYASRRPGSFLNTGCTRTEHLARSSQAVQLAEMTELAKCSKAQ